MELYERRIKETLIIDDKSPSGLRWGSNAFHRVRGKPAGRLDRRGYWRIGVVIDGKPKSFGAHRIVWMLSNGRWPKEDIDHINGDRADNRIANLREATRSENLRNMIILQRNTSGVKGVSFHKRLGKWQAYLRLDNRHIHIGLFPNINDAECAVRAAREKIHGDFANHGDIKVKP